jgi:single-strand DNA-binding protein
MGRLTCDIELKSTSNGSSVCNFNLAVSHTKKSINGEYDTDFWNCSAFGATAEFISRYFHKGSLILIDGNVEFEKYIDKQGNQVGYPKVTVTSVSFTGEKQ